MNTRRNILLAVLLVAGCAPAEPVWPGDCAPFRVPVAGWKAPYSVTVADTVDGWYQTEDEALTAAVVAARERPDARVRIASIVEVRFLHDGEGCKPPGAQHDETQAVTADRATPPAARFARGPG